MKNAFTITDDGGRARNLLRPIRGPQGEIDAIRLRPPKYREIMTYGDPTTLIVMDGAMLPTQDMGVVEKYIDALIQDDSGNVMMPALLQQLDYRDALALKDAVLDFFTVAASTTSSTPPTA